MGKHEDALDAARERGYLVAGQSLGVAGTVTAFDKWWDECWAKGRECIGLVIKPTFAHLSVAIPDGTGKVFVTTFNLPRDQGHWAANALAHLGDAPINEKIDFVCEVAGVKTLSLISV